MKPLFPLGKVTVKQEAALALKLSGQDADFFLGRHVTGDWGNADPTANEQGLRDGSMILSRYRTLFGQDLHVITFLDRQETCVFVPPNSVVKHELLPDMACWYPGGERPEGEPMKPQGGNGSGKFNVHSDDMGGWVRVHTDMKGTIPADLGLYLSLTLTEWFRQRPQLRMRCVVPITREGHTVELHAWFDCHTFPPFKEG